MLESQMEIDADAFPRLLETDALTNWYKSTQPGFKNESAVGSQYSAVVALNRSYSGEVLRIADPGNQALQASFVSIVDGKVRATRSDTAYSEYKEASIPASGDRMVIGATFGAEAGEISLQVNGIVANSAVVVQSGTPGAFTFLGRNVQLKAPTSEVQEYMVYSGTESTGSLDGKELNAISRYIATNQLIAGVKLDPSLVGGNSPTVPTDPSNPGGADRFLAAKAVYDGKCIQCHRVGGNYPNLTNLTEAKALSEGWVVKANPGASSIYNRLKGAMYGNGNPNMPTDSSLASSQVKAIEDWINGIK